MARAWKLNLLNPSSILETAIRTAWAGTMTDLKPWIEGTLVPALIYGDLGIQGIAETAFYRFISSPDGLSQLGIESSQPQRLLDAYQKAFRVSNNNNMLLFTFGDLAILKMMTPHPASGTGKLHIQSWLEWVIDGDTVNDAGYVPRSALPTKLHKSIRVKSAPGGLMLKRGIYGSIGTWKFPGDFSTFESNWINKNFDKIQSAIIRQTVILLNKRLK